MSGALGPRARPLTTQEAEQRREQMFDLDQKIRSTMNEGRAAVWKLAAFLDVWEDQNGWSALGYEKLNDWLADPDVSMTRGRFQDLVGTYRELKAREIDPAVIQQLEHSKVRIALPAVKRGEAQIEDVIDDTKALGAQDLRLKYRDQAAVHTAEDPSPEDLRQNPHHAISDANPDLGEYVEVLENGRLRVYGTCRDENRDPERGAYVDIELGAQL